MDIEVTSVSKTPEKLSETASAIQVLITEEDIRRSGATGLPRRCVWRGARARARPPPLEPGGGPG